MAVPTSARGGSVTAVSTPENGTPQPLLTALVAVFGATLTVLTLATAFPVWLSAAGIAASVAALIAWRVAAPSGPRWRWVTTVLSMIGAAVLFAFASEGVRSVLTDDTPTAHRYFVVVDQVYPRIAPDTTAGEAAGVG